MHVCYVLFVSDFDAFWSLTCHTFTIARYPQASLMFSWPIFFARLGGMACAVWTALLFLSMSRSILTIASRFLPRRGRSFWLLGGGWIFLHVF